ncbi:tigger transposable element-derived protein 6-like [Dermacentor albipictus]|uniref:tigger transposable element-derived protein 6-like n=1 Tax=Dermacentor albipictus TaxID=60249 RepID=UPI0038FC8666
MADSPAFTSTVKRKALDLATKLLILKDLSQGAKNHELVKKYSLSKSTISTILKEKDKIYKSAATDSATRKRLRKATYADVEDALLKWFLDTRARNVPISGPLMLSKAKDLAFLLDFPDFSPCNGWLHRFKLRHGIILKTINGESASVSDEDINTWMSKNLARVSSYAERDVYNADETALFYQMLHGKTHAMKGDKCAGGKHSKVRITVLLCTNMDGSNRCLPFVIGKSKRPRCFRTYVPVRYRHNSKSWMTRELFAEWLIDFDSSMAKKGRKVLLILDNCTAHHVQAVLSAVELLFLPPNVTSKAQPLDMGVIRSFKAAYRPRVVLRMLIAVDRPAANVPLQVSLYSAIEMIKAAWIEVTPECIRNCFRKAGFADAPEAGIEDTEQSQPDDDLWRRVVDANLAGCDLDWQDFVDVDDAAEVAESFCDETAVREVRASSDAEASNDDSDPSEPAPVSATTAVSHIEALRNLVYFKALGDEHIAALNKLETAVIGCALTKQTTITDFFSQ